MLSIVLSTSAIANETSTLRAVTLKRISTAEGLTQGTINHIFQDKDGFVWLSTVEGLNVYNGYSVRPFRPDGLFDSAYVEFAFQDREGLFWISVSEHGLYRYDPKSNEIKQFWDASETYLRDVMTWYVDDDGDTLWFFTTYGVLRYSFASGELVEHLARFPGFAGDQYIYTVEEIDGFFWLGTGKGLLRYDPVQQSLVGFELQDSRLKSARPERSNRIRKIQKDESGNLWVATAGGLFLLKAEHLDVSEASVMKIADNLDETADASPKRMKVYVASVIAAESLFDLKLEEERLLVAANSGLVGVDLETLSWQHLAKFSNSNYDIFNDRIIRLFKDNNQNYWLSSNVRGVFIWEPKTQAFHNYFNTRDNRILTSNHIWDIEEVEDGILWLGTTAGVTRFNVADESFDWYFNELDEDGISTEIYDIAIDSFGSAWLATSNGTLRVDTKTGEKKAINVANQSIGGALFDAPASILHVDDDDQLWILGSDSFYLYQIANETLIELDAISAQLEAYFSHGFLGRLPGTNTMLLSASGQLWGVDTLSFEPRLLYELPDYSPQELAYVDNWAIDEENGLLWLSFTSHGLVALSLADFKAVEHVKSQQVGEVDTVYGLLQDNNRRLWFSSHEGLHNYGLDNDHMMNFDLSSGLSAMEFNAGAWLKMSSGLLAYGSVNGFTLFDPDVIGKGKDPHKKVVIDQISSANQSWEPTFSDLSGQTFTIAHDDNGLIVHFSTLGFEQQQSVLYRYELVGRETIELPLAEQPYVRFSHLDSGTYELSVRAISPLTGYQTKPTIIYLNVLYPPWKSPLAFLSYAIGLLLIVASIMLRRRYKNRILVGINKQLFKSEKRLRIALKSSQSDAWEWSSTDKIIRFVAFNEDSIHPQLQTFKEHLKMVHPDDRDECIREWQTLFNSNCSDAVSLTYRYLVDEDDYRWYQNVGQILSRDASGYPQQISGLFTDVNEIQRATTRAMVFGEAFRNTKDWVLVIDSDFNGVTANESFQRAFNLEINDELNLNDSAFHGLGGKMLTYRQLMERMSVGEHWHGKEQIQLSDEEQRDVLINISLIRLENRKQDYYIVIFTDITQQKNAEEELKKLSNYDVLTGLPNRNLLIDRIDHAIKVADRNKDTFALLFVDLDRFKQINDSLGHEAGDELLKAVAERLHNRVRKQDTVARLGGDEFVVLMESFKNITHVGEVAEQISDTIANTVELGEHKVSITPSIGIAFYPGDAGTPEELLRDADIAMYHAKKSPGECYHFYTDSMDKEVRYKLQKESELKQAQTNREFVNFYQPIMHTQTGNVAGAELLLRWLTPKGVIPPNEFISLSEQIGLIIPMTNDALKRGLEDVKIWREKIPDFYLSVNLSVIHFEQDGVVESIDKMLREFELPPSAIRIEVTESALMMYPDKAIRTMQHFKEIGIILALDDFGTGYSSFAYLKRLPLDIVKLDRSFIWGIGKDDKDETIIEAILGVAANLGLKVVAEGIELERHLSYLKSRQCDYLQGFYFSKPINAEQFSEYIDQNRHS